MKKKVLSLIWTIAILMAFVPTCLAYDLNFSAQQPTGEAGGKLTNSIGTVLGVVQWIGFIVAIAMLIYVGIKYLTSGAGVLLSAGKKKKR